MTSVRKVKIICNSDIFYSEGILLNNVPIVMRHELLSE